ncbi:Pepsin-retropepsin like protein [Abeliophyllum distichum]|uniref:Pepsin-retropepsin like protein n=1 Tax=Abeliophyllum distichum TaxID=126358 RepID=A0ABD1TZD6_9LAMI
MEITDYEQKFEDLSSYAPYLVGTELMKARHYEKGLRPEVKQIVTSHALLYFRVVVEMAQIISFLGSKFKNNRTTQKKNWQDKNRNRSSVQFKRKNQGPNTGQSSNSIPKYPKYKKNHSSDCHFGKNVCYRCEELAHYVS